MIKFGRWMLVILCLISVQHFSRQPFSEQDLSPYIRQYPSLIQVVRSVPPIELHYRNSVINSHKNPIGFIQFLLRKAAHVTLYGLLGTSLLYALKGGGINTLKAWLLAALSVVAVAALDEYQQFNNPGRTGCIEDVILDFSGFVFLSLLALLSLRLMRK